MDITPLFAVDAEELLDQGLIDDAIELCKLGLEAYPGYPAGEAVLARCYKLSGDSDKANEILDNAMIKNPFNRALETLKKYDIEIPKKEIKVVEEIEDFELSYDDDLFDKNISSELEEVDSFELVDENEVKEYYNADEFNLSENEEVELEDNNILESIEIDENSDFDEDDEELYLDYEDINLISGLNSPAAFIQSNFETKLDLLSFNYKNFPSVFNENHQIELKNNDKYKELASKIENVKIKLSDKEVSEPEENEYKLEELVTETMANIFFEQGAYDEAIKAFKALIKKYPEYEEKYNLKIEEIKIEKEKELELNSNNKFFKEQK